ncbi:hypothetical protein RNJ44_04734 [Nakaseomyces bracarensis]|uniref:Uncharacterized protein n=1 Tax=Nakaseomyces bracarensis TaxID=273131 RepID=A0ABR4NVW1_9SACH
MRAVVRNRLMNNLYFTTFLIAFSSVAIGSFLPCPAHTLDLDSPEVKKKDIETNDKEVTK